MSIVYVNIIVNIKGATVCLTVNYIRTRMRNIRTKEHFFVSFIQCDKTGNLNKYSEKCLVMAFLRNNKISLTGTLKLVWVSHTKKSFPI